MKMVVDKFIMQLEAQLSDKGVSIMLSNDRQIQKLNHKWKGKNIPTNVLSFPNHEELLKRKTKNYSSNNNKNYK